MPNVRPTSANCPERTNMFVNFGYVGGESVVGVYRVISGRERKRTQENARERKSFGIFPGVHRLYSLMFRGLSCFIVFLSATTHTRKTPDRHTTSQGKTYGRPRSINDVDTKASRVPICIFTRFRPDVSPM